MAYATGYILAPSGLYAGPTICLEFDCVALWIDSNFLRLDASAKLGRHLSRFGLRATRHGVELLVGATVGYFPTARFPANLSI